MIFNYYNLSKLKMIPTIQKFEFFVCQTLCVPVTNTKSRFQRVGESRGGGDVNKTIQIEHEMNKTLSTGQVQIRMNRAISYLWGRCLQQQPAILHRKTCARHQFSHDNDDLCRFRANMSPQISLPFPFPMSCLSKSTHQNCDSQRGCDCTNMTLSNIGFPRFSGTLR